MTLPARIAFDPALPVKATQAFAITATHSVAQGEPIDWRELGIDEHTLHMWWLSGLVYFEAMPEPATLQMFVTPGERVSIETPEQQKKRRHAERR